MNQAQALHRLQMIDLAIVERKTRLAAIEARLRDNESVQVAEHALKAAEDALVPWRSSARRLELEIKSVEEKSKSTEQRLYGGKVASPKELQDMQEEIASLKRRKAKLEDDLLEAMIEVENGQAACEDASRSVEQARAEWESGQQDLIRERQQLQQALAGLRERREAALQNVSAESLAEYNALRPKKHGQAVAELVGDACKICGVSQTSILVQQVRQGHTLVHCANCVRILVIL